MDDSQDPTTIKCGQCSHYRNSSEPERGTCLLLASASNGTEKKSYMEKVTDKTSCRYGVHSSEEIDLTPQGIAGVLSRNGNVFWSGGGVSPSQIDMGVLEDLALSSPK